LSAAFRPLLGGFRVLGTGRGTADDGQGQAVTARRGSKLAGRVLSPELTKKHAAKTDFCSLRQRRQ
jgi:hypothetical protein